jgi:ATP-dependent RNA helicase DeaD
MPSTFNTLGLPEPLIDALAQLGITTPTDIQEKAFPVLNKSNDAWLSSPTGSGKTFAYLLPLLKHLNLDSIDLQVIILAPTHELAAQIHECIRTLYQSTAQKPRTQLIIGNASIKRQQEKLKKNHT